MKWDGFTLVKGLRDIALWLVSRGGKDVEEGVRGEQGSRKGEQAKTTEKGRIWGIGPCHSGTTSE